MRKLFFAATGLFWIAVMVLAVAGTSTAPEPAPARVPAPSATVPPLPSKPPAAQEQRYTLADVARHATESDCWMAINGAVYDFTAYLPDHPSRPSVILPWCGKEATEAYKTKTKGRPHSPGADQLLPTYRIGVLAKP
jgi:cytochrome b involved in lipid metabolism